jgi:hypothetical protein
MLPLESATAVSVGWVSIRGDSRKERVTVSPGFQPEPVMVTMVPGA